MGEEEEGVMCPGTKGTKRKKYRSIRTDRAWSCYYLQRAAYQHGRQHEAGWLLSFEGEYVICYCFPGWD